MGLKLIHISKRGNWWSNPLDITMVVLTINCLCKTFPDFAIKVLCFLTTINLTFKFQLMVHEKLSWRNCKCPVDLWQPGQIVLKKFHPSKNPGALLIDNVGNYLYLNNGSFKFEVDPHEFNLRLHHFSQFQRKGRKKKFKSWQISDWLAKWLIGLGFMDLRWLRVYRRSNVGLVIFEIYLQRHSLISWDIYCIWQKWTRITIWLIHCIMYPIKCTWSFAMLCFDEKRSR